jgi:hypothetical protein
VTLSDWTALKQPFVVDRLRFTVDDQFEELIFAAE